MAFSSERIYVIGATGKTGSVVVDELVQCGANVTVLVQSPHKVRHANKVTIVQGNFDDLMPFIRTIPGHSRLFLVASNFSGSYRTEISISQIAYAAGVKQIVHLSGLKLPWRSWNILHSHEEAEHAIYSIPERGAFVNLRPTNFISNNLMIIDAMRNENVILDSADPDEPQEWVSPNDIGRVAARILLDPVEKHGDTGYELIGDITTPSERAAILSKVLGRHVTYKQIPAQELYNKFIEVGLSHYGALWFSTYRNPYSMVTRGLPILLGRPVETWDVWARKNKNAFR
ncbi:hypothetical protein BJV82DRAFT_591115 [Fennellomyces sp. T-0311]|nr:hypothetical protein BJV82DRAFT_638067 [Fennellomyces sp. T-0311]KAI8149221.1 hypothetical protein BJV82DRAFT_591115 [Fennellomyces sp. T-0311]